jgi:uncharacterized protein YggU (UPF0235/DUF167 family)
MRIIEVRVKPSSKVGTLVQPALDGTFLVFVREPAKDGMANTAVRDALASYFEVPKTSVQMTAGRTSRFKRFKISTNVGY